MTVGGALEPTAGDQRKARGAFFTPPAIADYLATWAVGSDPSSRVLDPTCGDGAFLKAAGRRLKKLGTPLHDVPEQLVGVDIDAPTLREAHDQLAAEGLSATLLDNDFFRLTPPTDFFASIGSFDAVIGNPPFVRYQAHTGLARRLSVQAALRQGVRLSGLASSWAALLVHAGAFLRPSGRLAMVMPAEVLSVGYAEPVRQWLRKRFESVKLVLFERLQFDDVLENVVLLLAEGTGGCDAFSLYYIPAGEELTSIRPFDEQAVAFVNQGKWTDIVLPIRQRQLFRTVVASSFVPLSDYGTIELGTVTGANDFFTLTEQVREEYQLVPGRDVAPTCPGGTRHLRGLAFADRDWKRLQAEKQRVWIVSPSSDGPSEELWAYLQLGIKAGVPNGYKCRTRAEWWRPPVMPVPDVFFTYMSHRFPRLVSNRARVAYLNSMHGLRLTRGSRRSTADAISLVALNSVTLLGAEIQGRSYGGGLLKMEPREAASLPLPVRTELDAAWAILRPERAALDRSLREGRWTSVVARVDEVLLGQVLELDRESCSTLQDSARTMRARRLARGGGTKRDR